MIKITNDTSTLNGSLQELGETMAANLVAMGVTDATASQGLTTLAGRILEISPVTPTLAISLTADKSVLSYYDSESATLSATVTENGSAKEGATVEFFKGSTSLGTASTNSSGVATKAYSSAGVGDVSFTAECGNVTSTSITVEDCIFYDSCTSNAKASAWTIPSGVTSQYSSDGWMISANAYKQIKLTEKLTSACSVEFTVVDYSTPTTNLPPVIVYQYTNGETTPNQQLLLVEATSSFKALGNTISHSMVKGGVYKIEYDTTMKVYENNTLLASASNSVGLPTRFEFHMGTNRYVVYKDLKVKPL